MDYFELGETIDRLVLENQHAKAVEALMPAYDEATRNEDKDGLNTILGHLIHVYSTTDPPDVPQIERFCAEREKNGPSAYNGLQTAMTLYHATDDYARVVAKLHEAISQGKDEN